jgi:hypothetical protein
MLGLPKAAIFWDRDAQGNFITACQSGDIPRKADAQPMRPSMPDRRDKARTSKRRERAFDEHVFRPATELDRTLRRQRIGSQRKRQQTEPR